MRLFMALLLLSLTSTPLLAGGIGYYGGISTYEPDTGLFYQSIYPASEEKGGLFDNIGSIANNSNSHAKNVAIYNPITEIQTLIFNDKKPRAINTLIFEIGHDEDASVNFYNSRGDDHIRNNTNIPKRALKNRFVLEVINKENKSNVTELWTADKDGNNLSLLTTIPEHSSWHLDVKNSKIRIVSTKGEKLSITNYDW